MQQAADSRREKGAARRHPNVGVPVGSPQRRFVPRTHFGQSSRGKAYRFLRTRVSQRTLDTVNGESRRLPWVRRQGDVVDAWAVVMPYVMRIAREGKGRLPAALRALLEEQKLLP